MSPLFRRREPPPPDPAAADTEVVPPPEEYGYVEEEAVVEEPPPREPVLWPYLLLLLLLVLGGLGALYYFTQEDEADEKPVPAVVRLTEAQAIERLDDEGFQSRVLRRRSDEAPEGIVFAQEPGAGRELEEGSTVELLVSSGSATAEVPDVAGLEADRAEEQLREAGFEVRRAEVFSEEEAGTVVAQEPASGERARLGTEVRINVSQGTGRVDVPDVVGRTAAEAGSILRRAGLATPRVVSVPSPEPAGTVVAQNPVAGAQVRRGAAIRINVSEGGDGAGGAGETETETETETEAGETTGAGAAGTLTVGDTALLPLLGEGDLTRFAGQEVRASGLRIESIPGDEVFWVGPSTGRRILVRLLIGTETPPDLRPGDVVSFTGTLLENPPGFAAEVGVTAAEGGTLLARQGVHIEVAVAELDSGG